MKRDKEIEIAKELDLLLDKYGPEILHKLGNTLIEIANNDANLGIQQSIPVPFGDTKNDVPLSIPKLIEKYKNELVDIEKLMEQASFNESIRLSAEAKKTEEIIKDLSAWLVYNY